MSYLVLARKYRPQRFSDVIGQEHVTRTLQNALAAQRIAHGYIFSGHRGIGKTTIARILAMALNCRNAIGSAERPTAEPCEVCESCTEIRAGNAVDVIEIDAATNRGIDEIRELRDAARYRPARDKYKIYILDEAHQITDAAFNALLKTLEEPPEHIVFMMATTQPEDIPQTVRSRCQHYSFHAVKLVDIPAQQLARQFVRFLRNALIAKVAGLQADTVEDSGLGSELLQISPDEQRRAARAAALFSEEELTRFLQVMLRTFDELGYRQEQRFHFELGLLKLVHLRRLLPIEEALSQMGSGGGGGGGTRAPSAAAPRTAPAPS